MTTIKGGHMKKARDAKTDRIVAAALKGSTNAEIAERYGVSIVAVAHRLRKRGLVYEGVSPHGVWKEAPDE